MIFIGHQSEYGRTLANYCFQDSPFLASFEGRHVDFREDLGWEDHVGSSDSIP